VCAERQQLARGVIVAADRDARRKCAGRIVGSPCRLVIGNGDLITDIVQRGA